MRIALFHNLPSGGAKRALYEWTRRLATAHELDVYTLSSADHAFCDIHPFVQQYRIFDFTPHRLFKTRPWGRLNPLQRWRDLGELTRIGHCIAHEVDTRGYDVVFAHTCLYTFIPAFLGFLQTPAVCYLHEPFGPTFNRHIRRPYSDINKWREISRRFDPFIALYNRRLESVRLKSIRRTTRLLANSQFTQQQMNLAYNVDAPVCRLGVDTEDFHPMPSVCKQNFVISVGELSPRKGFDFLIKSLAHIPSDRRPALKLACNREIPAERRYLDSLAVHYNVELHVLTHLNTDQLALEYNKAQICVYAPVLEPLGLVPLESMACGTPVIGVAEGGVRETIQHGETGLLTDREPKQFADAILNLLTNPLLAEELGRRGPGYVQDHWNWDTAVACLESHLRATADEDPQHIKRNREEK